LMIWTLPDWRRRYRWAVSFLLTMAVLFAASEWVLPHWIPRFLRAVHEYRSYSDAVSVLDKLVPAPWNWLSRILTAAATLHVFWKNRHLAVDAPEFATIVSLALAVTVIIIPSYPLYNQVMLLPALLTLLRERQLIWSRNGLNRMLLSVVAIFLFWPWGASFVLACLSFVLPAEIVERTWAIPFWTVLPLALVVAAMVLIRSYQKSFAARQEPRTS